MEFVLRIILDKDDLHVTEMKTQYSIRNLSGHSVQLDSFATDSSGKKYNIEVQRADAGANPKRARYHSSLLDSHLSLQKGKAYQDLPENYVIFLTENDIFGDGLTIYHIERVLVEKGRSFHDGSHIIYVNAAQESDSALGKLMKDFMCSDPNDMNYTEIAAVIKYFKQNEQGVKHMCQIMETAINDSYHAGMVKGRKQGREEGREQERLLAEARRKAEFRALALLKEGLSVEKVAELTQLTVENVQELADIIL
ncbi:MAG: Rpn family recombination-promoting nuclease/putative transposase [Clostridia bacterium]|nr:Rpn family recombination-promoting nuclease/putative transposase [Clostridia bacterium]